MKILHVFRAPVGGLFRHVRDLCRGQAASGHEVGIVCDSLTGGTIAEKLLAETLPFTSLGIHRIAIARLPGIGDIQAARAVAKKAKALGVEVIHGHGAKGGVYGRLAARMLNIPSAYTPHGGSLHYSWSQAAGSAFLSAEWALARIGSGVVFVCNYERDQFDRKIGLGNIRSTVVYNGLWPEEFKKSVLLPDATDLVLIGDMRDIKGVDILIEAVALVSQRRKVTATMVGDGPSMEAYRSLASTRGLSSSIRFAGRLPTQAALASGRILVMPSRSESFPYVILEAAAAELPIIASGVGGIPEIIPASNLVPAEEPLKLAARIDEALASPDAAIQTAVALKHKVATEFSAAAMSDKITSFYQTLS